MAKEPKAIDHSELYFAQTELFGKQHIFNKSDEDHSLCGRYVTMPKNPDYYEPVNGTEKFQKRADCKTCFKKAGLQIL